MSRPRPYLLTNDIFEDAQKHSVTIWMQADWETGEPSVGDPAEVLEVAWFSWNSLPEPLFLPFRNLIDGNSYALG